MCCGPRCRTICATNANGATPTMSLPGRTCASSTWRPLRPVPMCCRAGSSRGRATMQRRRGADDRPHRRWLATARPPEQPPPACVPSGSPVTPAAPEPAPPRRRPTASPAWCECRSGPSPAATYSVFHTSFLIKAAPPAPRGTVSDAAASARAGRAASGRFPAARGCLSVVPATVAPLVTQYAGRGNRQSTHWALKEGKR